MKRVLIVSFSPIYRDPRVTRQIEILSEHYEVSTVGFGKAPNLVQQHFDVPRRYLEPRTAPQKIQRFVNVRFGGGQRAYWARPQFAYTRDWVKSHKDDFDVVLTNDVAAVPIGVASGLPFHADLHEYALDQGRTIKWRLSTLPTVKWAASLLHEAGSTSTVAPGIASRYAEEYGIDPFIVTNAPAFRPDITPTPTHSPIRLVHMGAANIDRRLDMPIRAVLEANKKHPGRFTLDNYLVPGDQTYIKELQQLAGNPKETGIRILEPITFEQIIPTLHKYDTAFAFFPPTTINLKHTLPNKFFEAVQARISVITGPSPEMGPYLEEYGFGTTTKNWTQESLNQTVETLTPETINQWKQATNTAAEPLGATHQDKKWLTAINRLAGE